LDTSLLGSCSSHRLTGPSGKGGTAWPWLNTTSAMGSQGPSVSRWWLNCLPSGKHTKSYGKSPFFMGKSTISDYFNGHFQ